MLISPVAVLRANVNCQCNFEKVCQCLCHRSYAPLRYTKKRDKLINLSKPWAAVREV